MLSCDHCFYQCLGQQGLECHVKHLFVFPEDPLAIDPLTIKMDVKIEPTEGLEEPASPESREAIRTPGTSASRTSKYSVPTS